ncbi:phosphotransferase [Porticoccaceae bacterium LTM1]|nr:phosphotransferase [Porticoccaceae bacterium LTM1]
MNLQTALQSWPDWQLGFTEAPQLIEQLEGGLTNRTFLLGCAGRQWVLRINAVNSESLGIDRQLEQHVLGFTSKAGLSPRKYYCDPDWRFLVTEFLPAWCPQELGQSELKQLAERMRDLHHLPITGVPHVDYLEYTEAYVQRLRDQSRWPARLAEVREREVRHIEKFQSETAGNPSAQFGLCHHDPSPMHWRIQETGLCLIDWEYSAVRDPACDLALLIDSWRLSDEQQSMLLAEYGDIAMQRVSDARRVCRYVNRLWFALQASDDESE